LPLSVTTPLLPVCRRSELVVIGPVMRNRDGRRSCCSDLPGGLLGGGAALAIRSGWLEAGGVEEDAEDAEDAMDAEDGAGGEDAEGGAAGVEGVTELGADCEATKNRHGATRPLNPVSSAPRGLAACVDASAELSEALDERGDAEGSDTFAPVAAASTGAQQSAAPKSVRRCGGAIMQALIIMRRVHGSRR
jgi:hypothetical protein